MRERELRLLRLENTPDGRDVREFEKRIKTVRIRMYPKNNEMRWEIKRVWREVRLVKTSGEREERWLELRPEGGRKWNEETREWIKGIIQDLSRK